MKMTMTATGDTILIQGFPEEGYPGLDEIRSYIAKGQAKFGNLEKLMTREELIRYTTEHGIHLFKS